jgi:hypothetical protein
MAIPYDNSASQSAFDSLTSTQASNVLNVINPILANSPFANPTVHVADVTNGTSPGQIVVANLTAGGTGVVTNASPFSSIVFADSGTDSVVKGSYLSIYASQNGNDVTTSSSYSTVVAGAGADNFTINGANDSVQLAGGSDTVKSFADYTTVNSAAGHDAITLYGNASEVDVTGSGFDTISVFGDYATIDTTGETAGSNIALYGSHDSVFGGNSGDTISLYSAGTRTALDLGAGNDSITIASHSGLATDTIVGGGGHDTVTFSDASLGTFQGFTNVDGYQQANFASGYHVKLQGVETVVINNVNQA